MTVAAGFDITAMAGPQTTAPGTAAAPGASSGFANVSKGLRYILAFGAPGASSTGISFRDGMEALLPALGEPTATTETAENSLSNNATTQDSTRAVLGQSGLASASTASNSPSFQNEIAATTSSAMLTATKAELTKPTVAAAAITDSKKAQSTHVSATHPICRPSSSDTVATPQPVSSQPIAAISVPIPVATPVLPVAPTAPATATTAHSASHDATSSAAPGAASALPSSEHAQPTAVPETSTIPATESDETSYTATAASVSLSLHAVETPTPTQSSAKQITSTKATLAPAATAQNDQSETEKPISRAIQSSSGMESDTAPSSAASSLKARASAPLRHDTTPIEALQTSANTSASQLHPSLVRDPAGIQGVSAERTSAAAASISSSAASDTFAALDSAPNQPATTWLHANSRSAEAGFLDPSLGWVSVRADSTSAGVHASVVPSSTDAAQTLSTHLAGLNAHLTETLGRPITASLAAPESSLANSQSFTSQHQQQGSAGSNAQQNQSAQHESSAPISTYAAASSATTAQTATATQSISNFDPSSIRTTRPGSISVVA